VLQTFKAQIEKQDQYNGAILAAQDVKLIFGNLPPLHRIHLAIRDALQSMVDNWTETTLTGTVISTNVRVLLLPLTFCKFFCTFYNRSFVGFFPIRKILFVKEFHVCLCSWMCACFLIITILHIQSGLNTTTLLVPKKYVSISNFPEY